MADGLFFLVRAGEGEPASGAEEEEPAAGAEEEEDPAGAEEEEDPAGAEEEEDADEGSCRARQTKSCLICLALVRFLWRA